MTVIDTERLLVYIALGEFLEQAGMTLDGIRQMAGVATPADDASSSDGTGATTLSKDDDIDTLGLGVYARNRLMRHDLTTIGSLTRLTEAQLLAIKHFGPTQLSDVKQRLHEHGFELAG